MKWYQYGDKHPEPEDICLVEHGDGGGEMPCVFQYSAAEGQYPAVWIDSQGNDYDVDDFDVWTICPRKDI